MYMIIVLKNKKPKSMPIKKGNRAYYPKPLVLKGKYAYLYKGTVLQLA